MDRLSKEGYETDKGPNYLRYYEAFFAPHRHRALNLLELGVHMGGSLQMWRDYFPYGQIFGVDIEQCAVGAAERIHTFVGDVGSRAVFDVIARDTGVAEFDIIIDDASHLGAATRAAFENLFRERLAPGGIYVIEDWGTGYRHDWPDGAAWAEPERAQPQLRFPSHEAGMVGYVKSLVDHLAAADVEAGGGRISAHPIDFITFAPGLVFIKKLA